MLKKLLIVSFSIVLMTAFSQDKVKKNDLQMENLKGKVKSVEKWRYNAVEKSGKISKGSLYGSIPHTLNMYNIQGNLIKMNEYDEANGTVFYNYKYDAQCNLIEIKIYRSNSTLFYKYNYKYNAQCNLIEENGYKVDGSLDYKYTYKYNSQGNKIEENWYLSDRSLNDKSTYKYDIQANNPKTFVGILSYKFTYQYDTQGNMVKEEHFHEGNGTVYAKSKYTYKYDTQGNIEEIYKSEKELDYRYTYKYDAQNNLIERNGWYLRPNGNLSDKSSYKYDTQGNRIEEIYTSGSSSLNYKHTYKYIYDSQGNWVEKVQYNDNKAQTITTREIKYY